MVIPTEQREIIQRASAPDGTVGPLVDMLCQPGDLGQCGRLFGHIKLIPGAAIPDHDHNGEFEYYYILRGQGRYNDNGAAVSVGVGDVTLCPSGERHGLANTGDDILELIAFVGYNRQA